jgi:uncharacterized repeat protein (TIGR02543 family)
MYAQWTPVNYIITYNTNGGANNPANPGTYNVQTPTITLANPTLTGFTFGGWYDNEAFTGSAVTSIPMGSTGTKTFYAKWPGKGSITVVNPTDVASGAFTDSSFIIDKTPGGTNTHTINVTGAFDSYLWRVDGSAKGSGNSLTLNAADYTFGTHQISLEVTRNGVVYSKSGSFTVQN